MVNSVLIIAGSDSSAGAGIQADLKTCAALGVYATTAITAVTAQNMHGVSAVHEVPAAIVADQIDAVVGGIRPDAVKTGMLASAAIVDVVAAKMREHDLRHLVVDPVMVATSGYRLLREDALQAMRELLLPLAEVATPNIPEAEALTGLSLQSDADIRHAARAIFAMGPRNVVIKGGHLGGEMSVDVLFDGREFREFSAQRVDAASTHGTGCTFASAISAFLAAGEAVPDAVSHAKEYVTGALRLGRTIGSGWGCLNHFWRFETGD